MKRKIIFILFLLAIVITTSCRQKADGIRNGDLVFVGLPAKYEAEASSIDAAISAATGIENQVQITHVCIVEVAKDSLWIIDATPNRGVSRRPLKTFLEESRRIDGSSPEYIVKRVKGINTDAAVVLAKSFCGRSYDFRFLPDNEEFYCSELIQQCYLDARGEPIFESQPMNFLAPDGSMPPFWEQLFRQLEMEVPQGIPGTNPQHLSESEFLTDIAVEFIPN